MHLQSQQQQQQQLQATVIVTSPTSAEGIKGCLLRCSFMQLVPPFLCTTM